MQPEAAMPAEHARTVRRLAGQELGARGEQVGAMEQAPEEHAALEQVHQVRGRDGVPVGFDVATGVVRVQI